MSRESTIEFEMNYCQHYKPRPGMSMEDYCALGKGASDMMNKARALKEPNMSPCIGGHKCADATSICPDWIRRTRESGEKRADMVEAAMERMSVVMPAVSKWRTKPKPAHDRREVIECPKCKGRLHLSQSSYNGHVHAHCETKDCVSWME